MKRSTIYALFSITVIIGYAVLIFELDANAVRDLEFKFNQQQSIQVDLAKRSIEEQFSWQINKIKQITTDLSNLVAQSHFYDMSGKRLLYSARSINQVSTETLQNHLLDVTRTSPESYILMWTVIEQDGTIFVPGDENNPNNAKYRRYLASCFEELKLKINGNGTPYITPIYASPSEQFVGVFITISPPEGRYPSVVGAIIDLNPIIQQFVVPVRSGQYGAAWLQDFNGQVIFDHEKEIIGKNVFDLHANYPELLALDHRYPMKMSGTAEYSFTVQRGGAVNRKIMAWNTAMLGNQGVTVALSAPDTEISALLRGSRQASLLLGVILIILLVGSGGFFYYLRQTELQRLVKERTQELEEEQKLLQLEIADRQKAEIALRNSEANFRQLAENIREVFFLYDVTSGQLLYISPAYETIWKHDTTIIQNSPFRILSTIYPEDKLMVRDYIRSFWEVPDVLSIEFRILSGDGYIRWIRWRAFPFFNEETIERVICTAEDITVQKQAHEAAISIELERKRTQLLANFVQSAFHEFRTPLSIINTSVYLLENVSDEDRKQEYLQFIREETANIMKLVEQLVTMSRLDVDESLLEHFIHVDTMMSDLQIMMTPHIESAKLQAAWDFNAVSNYVQGDSEQLHRALKSIIDNAIKFSNPGDSISVKTYTQGECIYIDIADTGEGIPADQLDSIFDRFYRVDSARSTRGFGLGLSIAKRIIERHNGTIGVESKSKQGSLFRIELPIAQEKTPESLQQPLA